MARAPSSSFRKGLGAALSLAAHLADRRFAREWLLAGYRLDAEGKAPVREFYKLYPETAQIVVELGDIAFCDWNMDPTERFVLGAIARLHRPRRVFEFGTFDGSATLTLARNAPDAEIATLDVPTDHPASAVAKGITTGIGTRFQGTPEAERITRVTGDSATFDFAPWRGVVDLVLIDAGHTYEDARADTAAALAMLSPNGAIVWDDYTPSWPGVIRAVDETRLPVSRIAGTELALFDRDLRGGSRV